MYRKSRICTEKVAFFTKKLYFFTKKLKKSQFFLCMFFFSLSKYSHSSWNSILFLNMSLFLSFLSIFFFSFHRTSFLLTHLIHHSQPILMIFTSKNSFLFVSSRYHSRCSCYHILLVLPHEQVANIVARENWPIMLLLP